MIKTIKEMQLMIMSDERHWKWLTWPYYFTLLLSDYYFFLLSRYKFYGVLILILFFDRRVQCDRNTIHQNLFVACLLRSVDYIVTTNLNSTSDSTCLLVNVVQQCFIFATYSWVFIEALYLHNVLVFHTFNEKNRKRLYTYIGIGWGLCYRIIITENFGKLIIYKRSNPFV